MVHVERSVLVDNYVIDEVVVEMVYKSTSYVSRVLNHLIEVSVFQMLCYPVDSIDIVAYIQVTTDYSFSFFCNEGY